MQWLINTIKELIHSQLGYFNRGDPAAVDWRETDLLNDNIWHTLDCSSIVPADARGICFFVFVQDNNINSFVQLRPHGHVNAQVRGEVRTQVSNAFIGGDIVCSCDADRKVDYRTSAIAFTLIAITVKAWWLR